MLGTNFPTLFFLTRGIKTHNFKPFENAIAQFQDAPSGVAQVSHLHRLDESRHMATALHIARLSNHILEQQNFESRQLFKAAVHAAWPKDRMAEYRIAYWSTVLKEDRAFNAMDAARAMEEQTKLKLLRKQQKVEGFLRKTAKRSAHLRAAAAEVRRQNNPPPASSGTLVMASRRPTTAPLVTALGGRSSAALAACGAGSCSSTASVKRRHSASGVRAGRNHCVIRWADSTTFQSVSASSASAHPLPRVITSTLRSPAMISSAEGASARRAGHGLS